MERQEIDSAAALLWRNWSQTTRIAELPAHCRPGNRAEAYAIQAEVARLSGQTVVGWKIAATSLVGQRHIGVDGPLAGRLLAGRVFDGGANVSLGATLMRVGEAEFAFRFAKSLPKRAEPYAIEEVLAAVESLSPAIEIPDSRYYDFARVGAAQLIADNACACWFVLGAATEANWRERDLSHHDVAVYKNGSLEANGSGANVLGDPRLALTWIANELRVFGEGLRMGEVVTTGTCITPVPIAPGDRLWADFRAFGTIEATIS